MARLDRVPTDPQQQLDPGPSGLLRRPPEHDAIEAHNFASRLRLALAQPALRPGGRDRASVAGQVIL